MRLTRKNDCPCCGSDIESDGRTERCAFCRHRRDLDEGERRKFLRQERMILANQKKNGRMQP